MYEKLLVRYGDLTLKGKNKRMFIDRVNNLVREKLSEFNVTYDKMHDRLYINLKGENYKEVVEKLNLVSGLYSYSLVSKCDQDMDNIKKLALEVVKFETKDKQVSFKVESKRSDKTFEKTSPEISKDVAAYVLSNSDNLTVDVRNPEFTLRIEVRKEGSFIFTSQIKGMGGFPVGVAGKGLLMISGGIDSPVAGYLSMKQGVEIECIHYESTPLTSIESAQKVIDLVEQLSKYAPRSKIKLHMVPFMELHKELLNNIRESYNITIMRRMMYRIAEKIAKKNNCLVLLNGESVGQVASQTLDSMSVINSVTNMPVIRPLATMDKLDIIKISRVIDTYNTSIKPFEDCCTVYVPKNPVTRPVLEKCELYEKAFEFEPLIEQTVENTKTITLTHKEHLDITMLGLVVRECI